MAETLTNEQMKFIVARLLDNASEAQKFEKQNGKSEFTEGLLSAYYAMLDTIKNQMIIDDADLKEFGLDIELEKKLA